MTERIGQWARRATRGKSHLVESQVADRYVMRCGKEMELNVGGGLIFDPPMWGFPACAVCAGSREKAMMLNDQPTLMTRGTAP